MKGRCEPMSISPSISAAPAILYCNLESGGNLTVEQREGSDLSSGEEVWLNYDLNSVRLFSSDGERLRPIAPARVATA